MSHSKVILFGGNGFVGTHIAERLIEQGVQATCVSRTGTMPFHLKQKVWAEKVEWVKGNATEPNLSIFEDALAVICLIGSPPIPTFSHKAYKQQLFANSEPNLQAIASAKASGIKQLVVLGAHLPNALQTDRFAYAKGKRLCLEATREFADTSDAHGGVVLQPTGIYGIRHNAAGKSINLGKLMQPLSKIQGGLPAGLQALLPEQLVSAEAVAQAAVSACLENKYRGRFSIISNQQILTGPWG